MDTLDLASKDFFALASNDESGQASLPTSLPPPPRMPTFVPHAVTMSIAAPRPNGLRLVASNAHPHPMQTHATLPALRLVRGSHPSVPPPSIPPTGSTPIRSAA